MVKRNFDGDDHVADEERPAGEVIFESKDDTNAKEIEGVFRFQGFSPGDEIYFELDGVRKTGVISDTFYTKPSIDPPGSTDYCMVIDVQEDPQSRSGQILKVECSLDDITSDFYKIEKTGDADAN